MTYRLAVNRSSVHIDGISARTQSTGNDTGNGHVAYYAETACGALSRGRFNYRNLENPTEDMREVLRQAQVNADINGRKVCKTCTKAAEEIIAQQ